jgi:hypothetical protein
VLINLLSIEPVQLATQSVDFNLYKATGGIYSKVVEFASKIWPDLCFYGDGLPKGNAIHIPRTGATRSYSHCYFKGIRYGSAHHYRGRRSRYGYIQSRQPAQIEYILSLAVMDTRGEERSVLIAVVRRFRAPDFRPPFPWEF